MVLLAIFIFVLFLKTNTFKYPSNRYKTTHLPKERYPSKSVGIFICQLFYFLPLLCSSCYSRIYRRIGKGKYKKFFARIFFFSCSNMVLIFFYFLFGEGSFLYFVLSGLHFAYINKLEIQLAFKPYSIFQIHKTS